MNTRLENRWVLALLFLLAIISGWQVYDLSSTTENFASRHRHFPDSIGYQLTLKRFDNTGFLSSAGQADTATHYPDTQTTEFKNVAMQLFNHRPEVSPWFITAPAGKAYNHGKQFELNGQVVMNQAAYTGHPATQILTSEVNIFPDTKLVTTAQPVLLTQPGLTVHAIGLNYNYDTEILDLLSQVQVSYDPAKYPKK